MKIRAFTIAEFILCIVIMFVIIGAAVPIAFKKAKQTDPAQKLHDSIVCTCANSTVAANDYECEFKIDNLSGRHEFFTIQLLGGGAAGGDQKGGAAGEAKIITYPVLTGKYLIKLGKGGEYNGANINGGNTVLYKVVDSNVYQLLEFARGGVGANEKFDPDEDIAEDDPILKAQIIEDMKKGELPAFSSSDDESTCGAGGNVFSNGRVGEAVIKW